MNSFPIKPSPILTIAKYDTRKTIRVVGLPDALLDHIWNDLTAKRKKNNKMKRYFFYKADNPPLATITNLLPSSEKYIKFIKGHGMSNIIKIPKILDVDLAYILGALRDGGIHYDKKNKAYKIHFSQKSKKYLEKEILPKLVELFDINPPISKRKDGVYQLQFASKPIYLFLAKVFDMKGIQQYWKTPQLVVNSPRSLKKEYIHGFHDAEGSKKLLSHSWYQEGECPPLQFISDVLNTEFSIKTSIPRRMKTNEKFNRYPAYYIYINDYKKFKREILERR